MIILQQKPTERNIYLDICTLYSHDVWRLMGNTYLLSIYQKNLFRSMSAVACNLDKNNIIACKYIFLQTTKKILYGGKIYVDNKNVTCFSRHFSELTDVYWHGDCWQKCPGLIGTQCSKYFQTKCTEVCFVCMFYESL